MTRFQRLLLAIGLFLAIALAISLRLSQAQSQNTGTVTPAVYLHWRTQFKNWGRWGPDDQRGTSNLITASKVLSAVKLVRSGIVVSLAHPVPQHVDAETPPSAVFHRVTNGISDTNTTDNYQVSYHGLTALSHGCFLSFLLRRQDVQRLFRRRQHHAGNRM